MPSKKRSESEKNKLQISKNISSFVFTLIQSEHSLKACSHHAKVNLKAKKIKEQLEEIKGQMANIKEKFRFHIRFCLVWSDL